jgi:hypothetical protein
MRIVLRSVVVGLAVVYAAAHAAEPEKYGAGVSIAGTTPLIWLVERPAAFEGRTVRVEGTVTAVCTHMGCWMALAPTDSAGARPVMIKVDDGVIVFPITAKGRRAVAQGVVERVGGDPEGQSAADEHAKATGTARSDPAATWQIKATGALIY